MTLSDIRLTNIIAPHFYDVHKAIKNHDYTHYKLKGGRGTTKSSFFGIEIVLGIINNPNCNALILRKVANTLRDSVYAQIAWAIAMLEINHKFKLTVSPMEITYIPTGQKIFFRGADEPGKIKSIKVKCGYFGLIWIEEYDQFSGGEEIRKILQSVMRGADDFRIFYSFNPPKSRDNWANIDVMTNRADTLIHHSTYKTVPPEWLGKAFLTEAEELEKGNPQAYEHEYLGIATGTGGQVFENIVERVITDDEIKTIHEGIDFGFAVDPFVWIQVSYIEKYRRLLILDEIYEEKVSNRKAVEKIRNRKHKTVIYADSAEPKSISEMQELGLNISSAKKGADSVDHGIKWLQDLNEIVIDKRRTPNAYREFTIYEYEQTKDGRYISRYPDTNNHTIDGVRYALYPIIQSKTVKTFNIKTF